MYTLTDGKETFELTHEEWTAAQLEAFKFIKNKRNYNKDFEDLVNS